jgi:hypothetical protein
MPDGRAIPCLISNSGQTAGLKLSRSAHPAKIEQLGVSEAKSSP